MQILSSSSHEFSICGKYIDIESISQRIKIYDLPNEELIDKFIKQLKNLGRQKNCDRLIFFIKDYEKQILDKFKCSYEGMIEGFFNGKDAFIYAMFLNEERNQSELLPSEKDVLEFINKRKTINERFIIPKGYNFRWAEEADTIQMAKLYDTVFESYPTPMNDPSFIIEMMNNDVYFSVIEKDQEIVSACSADVLTKFNSAELTDCATLPEHRNKGLLSYQVLHLISLMKKMRVQTFFSYSRSLSIGMNFVNLRHGFKYGGRMVQNSFIGGSLENMNIWYKKL